MTPGAGIFRTKLPIGFTASGLNCGIRRYRPDVGLIVSQAPCVAHGVFTQNPFKASPVRYCEKLLPSSNIRAIITNSGQANAGTGLQGEAHNQTMANTVASHLQCKPQQVLTASTGVIGVPLAIDKIVNAIPTLITYLSTIAEKFALAILTTDLVPKTIYKDLKLSQGNVRITGICKGSGMIHPNMATMLGYLLTDAMLTESEVITLLKTSCDESFNMMSIDGETSTNDCVFLLANGMSGVRLVTAQDKFVFYQALEALSKELAKSIVRDGEGASKLIEIVVKGMPEQKQAKQLARQLTTSPLIKTAIYGASPNWGRIFSRLGMDTSNPTDPDNCTIYMQGIPVFQKGVGLSESSHELREKMHDDIVSIEVDFHSGEQQATAWTCDFTENYIKINAEYVT